MKLLLFKPFEKYSEHTLLLVGILSTIIGSFAAFAFNLRFDGVIDIHMSTSNSFFQALLDNLINIFCLVLFLFASAKFINKKTRLVDILTATMVARIPFYLLPILNVNGMISTASEELIQLSQDNLISQISFSSLLPIIIFGIFTIVFLVWYISLLFNGYKTASNAKGNIPVLLFIASLLFAEILSKLLVYQFN